MNKKEIKTIIELFIAWNGETEAIDVANIDSAIEFIDSSFQSVSEDLEEVEKPAPTAYVVTRCEEHSDYVEQVFFDEDKAQKYCDQFKGNENEYARHITEIEVTL
jgi:hypothetical protein